MTTPAVGVPDVAPDPKRLAVAIEGLEFHELPSHSCVTPELTVPAGPVAPPAT
jgi:hypothetical protein